MPIHIIEFEHVNAGWEWALHLILGRQRLDESEQNLFKGHYKDPKQWSDRLKERWPAYF